MTDKGKKVFTVPEVAKLLKVPQRTVETWFDSGRLDGYRISGTRDRRVPRECLVSFMGKHGLPGVEDLQ